MCGEDQQLISPPRVVIDVRPKAIRAKPIHRQKGGTTANKPSAAPLYRQIWEAQRSGGR